MLTDRLIRSLTVECDQWNSTDYWLEAILGNIILSKQVGTQRTALVFWISKWFSRVRLKKYKLKKYLYKKEGKKNEFQSAAVVLSLFRACLHEGGRPQVGEVTCVKLPDLTCKRDHIKMRDYVDRRVTPPKRVTPPPCKQALRPCLWELAAISTSPIINLVCPPTFCITFVFHFSWVLQSFQYKLETMLMQNFGGKQGAL